MKKNGPLLRDSITEEENAAAHWPVFFLFSSRCQSLRMLDIRAGMALKQTMISTIPRWEIISFCNYGGNRQTGV